MAASLKTGTLRVTLPPVRKTVVVGTGAVIPAQAADSANNAVLKSVPEIKDRKPRGFVEFWDGVRPGSHVRVVAISLKWIARLESCNGHSEELPGGAVERQ